jgi:hypothetical protein
MPNVGPREAPPGVIVAPTAGGDLGEGPGEIVEPAVAMVARRNLPVLLPARCGAGDVLFPKLPTYNGGLLSPLPP